MGRRGAGGGGGRGGARGGVRLFWRVIGRNRFPPPMLPPRARGGQIARGGPTADGRLAEGVAAASRLLSRGRQLKHQSQEVTSSARGGGGSHHGGGGSHHEMSATSSPPALLRAAPAVAETRGSIANGSDLPPAPELQRAPSLEGDGIDPFLQDTYCSAAGVCATREKMVVCDHVSAMAAMSRWVSLELTQTCRVEYASTLHVIRRVTSRLFFSFFLSVDSSSRV